MNLGDIVEYVGEEHLWSERYVRNRNIGRRAKVVDPSGVPGSEYFMSRPDIDTCIEWLDAPENASFHDRFVCTLSKRLRKVEEG